MEKTWKLPGAYATWALTLSATPPEGAPEPFTDEWPEQLDRLGEYFVDLANLIESNRFLDEISRRGNIQPWPQTQTT